MACAVCHEHGVPFVVNDRPDPALEVGADGVHVGQDDAPVSLARRILGPAAIVGLSTHGEADLAAAAGEDVSYISAGPVEATPTKPGRKGTGTAYVSLASARSSVPVFVTGGVSAGENPSSGCGGCAPLRRGALPDPSARRGGARAGTAWCDRSSVE